MSSLFVNNNWELQEEMNYHYQVIITWLKNSLLDTIIKKYKRMIIFGMKFKTIMISN